MPPVRTLRLGLLVVPAAIVGALIHVNGDGGVWELLVWGLAIVTAILAFRLAQREAATSLARIAAATGTVPYSGRLHPDGSWRGHVAGPGAARMLGRPYSAEGWAAALHPDDAAAFAEACQRAARGEPSEVEYRIVRPDGETREIWDRFAPSRGGTVAGVRVDVTERRATERELSSAQHRLESLLRQLDDAVRDARGAARRQHRRRRRAGLGRRRATCCAPTTSIPTTSPRSPARSTPSAAASASRSGSAGWPTTGRRACCGCAACRARSRTAGASPTSSSATSPTAPS